MWKKNKVSVVLPTYNEKDSIKNCIEDFFATGYVDEVVVVNNNARAGTEEEVKNTGAIHVIEKNQGYGHAIWRGFDEATGDYIVLCEPDGTFEASDLLKILAYADDFDAVWGTRTNLSLISHGANMGFDLRVGNVLVAKLMQSLFNTSRLTDVGCSFKLFKRAVIEDLRPKFTIGAQHFGPELMMLTILSGYSFVEIPVGYHTRVGRSSVTGSKITAILLGMKMVALIFVYFFENIFKQSKLRKPYKKKE